MKLSARTRTIVIVIVVVIIVLWIVFNPGQAKNDFVNILEAFWQPVKHIFWWLIDVPKRA